jgi:hypothetical protein
LSPAVTASIQERNADPRSELDLLVNPPLRADARRNYEALLAAADELFTTGRRDHSELVAACQAAVAAIGTSLLRRAKDGGAVRTDVTLPDVVTLVTAIAMATKSSSAVEADRMLAIVLAGIASR